MNHPYLFFAWIIFSNVVLYCWMRHARRKRKQDLRERTMRRVMQPYALDMFPREPRERYTLTPLDIAMIEDLVEGKKR